MHSEKKDFEEKTKRFDEMTKRVRKQLIQQRVELELKRQQLESEKEEFAKQQSLINEDTKIIELNVGGEIFMAQKATLARYNHSLLARQLREEAPCQYDKNGRLFIDRNPKTFRLVLDYLRNGSLPAQFTSDEVKRAFEHDMEYFQLGPQQIPFIPLWSKYLKSSGVTISEDGKSAEVSGADGDHLVLLGDKKLMNGTVTITVRVSIPRPNRYSFGVLLDQPRNFNKGFAYKPGVVGWGLHDHTGSLGIFLQTQQVAPSTLGYATNDLVTMTVDVDRGNLFYKVNGVKCAELLNCEMFQKGVWLAATLYNKGATWVIISN